MNEFKLGERASGVLMHVTSLPGPHGSGDLGPSARRFVDFLARAGQRWWQTLPVNPVGAGYSPYSGLSAFAGNPYLISLDELVEEGLLMPGEVDSVPSGDRIDHAAAIALREPLLRKAFTRFQAQQRRYEDALEQLRTRASFWLDDYTVFSAALSHYRGQSWTLWDDALKRHEPEALRAARRTFSEEVSYREFEQLMFDRQWRALHAYAHEHGVGLIGDVPIYVAHQSADVWGNQASFRLDAQGEPTHVSGVPPDYFSKTGQRWGTPLYRWRAMARGGYRFWVERLRAQVERFDIVRLDHFIGFARYWEIEASEDTAVNGRWMLGPGAGLFEAVRAALAPKPKHEQGGDGVSTYQLPFIAEDLGCVNERVRVLRDQFALPGMHVLQFGLGSDRPGESEHLPHNFAVRSVAYTGTHDTDTARGWFEDAGGEGSVRTAAQAKREHKNAMAYLAGPLAKELHEPVHRAMIRVLFASPAQTAVVPIQDWLGLESSARMNLPGKAEGQWGYRLREHALTDELVRELRTYAETYGRCPRAVLKAHDHVGASRSSPTRRAATGLESGDRA